MSKQKRLAGRAIRKQRREQAELLARFQEIDIAAIGRALVEAFQWATEALSEALTVIGQAMRSFTDAYLESVQREYRMNFRALTTGPKESN